HREEHLARLARERLALLGERGDVMRCRGRRAAPGAPTERLVEIHETGAGERAPDRAVPALATDERDDRRFAVRGGRERPPPAFALDDRPAVCRWHYARRAEPGARSECDHRRARDRLAVADFLHVIGPERRQGPRDSGEVVDQRELTDAERLAERR